MSNEQLQLLLETLRSELAQTIEESERLFSVHGVEREPKIVYVTEDGLPAQGLAAAMVALAANRIRREDDPFGRFVALAPLDTLVSDWEIRFDNLIPETNR